MYTKDMIATDTSTNLEVVTLAIMYIYTMHTHIPTHTHSCLQPVLLQLAQKGSPELAKHAVKCIQSVFKEPKPILMILFTVRNRKV